MNYDKQNGNMIVMGIVIVAIVVIAIILIIGLVGGNGKTPEEYLYESMDTSAQKAEAAKNKNNAEAIKDEISLATAEYLQEYYESKYANNTVAQTEISSSRGDYVITRLKEDTKINKDYVKIEDKTITIYSDTAKTEKQLEGTVDDTGTIKWN